MEDAKGENNRKKNRARDDSELDSSEENRETCPPESKRVKMDSEFNSSGFNRVDSTESGLNSPEANLIADGLLDILDDFDTASEFDSAIPDLDSVIRSFEEEILHHSPPPQQPAAVADCFSVTRESPADLGYLLEASDDELGLPPTESPSDVKTATDIEPVDLATPEAAIYNEILRHADEMPSYDSLGFGICGETQPNSSQSVTVGEFYDSDSADFSELWCRPESLHAV